MRVIANRSTEDVISAILNCICPECGGPMGLETKEFKCQGQCGKDWRSAWELTSSGPKDSDPRKQVKQIVELDPGTVLRP